MVNFALLLLRLVFGGLMAGHGSQKLFGWFGGYGLQGTSGWLESLGFKPGNRWAWVAGLSEFGGGVLTMLGFLGPTGPLATLGSMGIATFKVHWGKPIWVSSGGAELPVLNMTITSALAISGPGEFSLDRLLNLHVPRWLAIPGAVGAICGVGYALYVSSQTQQAEQQAQQTQQAEQPASAAATA